MNRTKPSDMEKGYNHKSPFFRNVLEQYKLTKDFNSSRIRQDLTKEQSISKDYSGRELYELIQNAEDEKSEKVTITLDTSSSILTIANSGRDCSAFTEEGFCSIMMSDMSPKKISQNEYIGSKGLGFRSLINWAEEISIISGGVKCTFSREIARKYWLEIKSFWENQNDIDASLSQKHEEIAREQFDLDSPLPMLSVPEVEESTNDAFTTKIVVRYKPECLPSIKKQIDSLSGKVLLFLRNLNSIDISIDGKTKSIKKMMATAYTSDISHIITYDEVHPEGQEWWLFLRSGRLENNKRYEIALAFDPKTKEPGEFIYTFFPTRVRMGLPLVVHATLDLNSSRNSINESEDNDKIHKLLAQAILDFAEQLAIRSEEKSWIFYELTILNDVEAKDFPILNKVINEGRSKKPIYPTIGKGYLKYNETTHYCEGLSRFLSQEHPITFPGMENHLIEGYSKYIPDVLCDNILTKYVNGYSREIAKTEPENIDLRTQLIVSILDVYKSI